MTKMRYNCAQYGCQLATRTDPVFLDGCLPDGASFCNLDAIAEISNKYLPIEFKPPDFQWGKDKGQRWLLERLSCLPQFTVLLVGADGNDVTDVRLYENGEEGAIKGYTTENLREWVYKWGVRARHFMEMKLPDF